MIKMILLNARKFIVYSAFVTAIPNLVHAESLDIGGIEIHLGQKINEALKLLSVYDTVHYNDNLWTVSRKEGAESQVLGVLEAKNNLIYYISKSVNPSDGEVTPEIYTWAANKLREYGGNNCYTREDSYSKNRILGFVTHCGMYRLSYHFALDDPKGFRASSGLFLSVSSGKKP